MITNSTFAATILAFAGAAALLPSTANAVIVYNDGDLILGFRASGNQGATTDYLIDLGSASSIVNSTSPITFSIGNIGADLTTIFGGWSTRPDVFWSVSGVQKSAGNGFLANTIFATRSDTVDGPLGTNTTTPWSRPSSFGAGAPALKVQALGTKYGGADAGQSESIVVPGALIQATSVASSYAFYQANVGSNGAAAFAQFSDPNGIEGNFASGPFTGSGVLDLYQVVPGSGASAFKGNFTIDNLGAVTFTPTPEPTAAIGLALGATVLASLRRRRTSVQLS